MRETGNAEVYGCNIKYQQYCSWSQSFDTRKIKRGRDGIRRRRCPSGGGSAHRTGEFAAERVLEFKMAVAGSREPLCVGNPSATPSLAHDMCVSLRSVTCGHDDSPTQQDSIETTSFFFSPNSELV